MSISAASAGRTGSATRTARLGWYRTLIEIRQFTRTPEQVFFTFLLPVLFVVIFSTVFSDDLEGPPGTEPVAFPQYFVAGMIAAGVMSTTFTSLAMTVAIEQHEGLLKRLAGTPLPRASYFLGKIGLATITSVVQAAIILAIGTAFYGMSLPSGPANWLVFAWVFLLGVASCSLLGIAFTRLIPNAASASAIVQPPYLTLQFISGVFFQYGEVPRWLQIVASVFPLKWMVQGFRYVFLPDWLAVEDYGGAWHLERVALVLLGWTVAAFVLALLFFRWDRQGDK